MKRAYTTPPKFAEIPDSAGIMRYYIQYTEDGSRKRIRCEVGDCRCINKGNRYCEHKINALREFQDFQAKQEAMQQGKDFNIPIADLLDEYGEYGKANQIHGESTQTLVKYQTDIFFNFCFLNSYTHIKDIGHQEALKYVAYLNQLKFKKGKNCPETNYSQTYININLRNIRALFNYAIVKKYITENPFSGQGKTKHQKIIKPVAVKPRNILKNDEIKTLKEKLNGQWLNVFTVFIYSGLRLSELTHLTWDRIQAEHINISENLAVGFKPKWNISRRIRMNQQLQKAFESQRQMQETAGITTNFVFCTSNGTQLSNRNVDRFFRNKFKQLGIVGEFGNGMSVHCFRHTFITGLINANIPLPIVQGIAGHQRHETTLLYFRQLSKNQDVIADFDY